MLKDLKKFGGNVSYVNYNQLESDFAEKKLHPGDLKAYNWKLSDKNNSSNKRQIKSQ